MEKAVLRLNDCNNIDQWVSSFNTALDKQLEPIKEVSISGSRFSDWRISYGIQTDDPALIYVICIYPPFCVHPKTTYHYHNLSELAADALTLENFTANIKQSDFGDRRIDAQDVIAAAAAILRNKESIELFQEQKDLMELGLQHYHLDNFYQDVIRELCKEYEQTQCLYCKPFHLTLFDRMAGRGKEKE